MANNKIQIKRTTGVNPPSGVHSLLAGELAYVGGLNKLYIGSPSDASNLVIGGKYYTDLLDVTAPGTADASKAVVLDAQKSITGLGTVGASAVNADTVGSITVDGNLTLSPNGTGLVSFYSGSNSYQFPVGRGDNKQVLTTNGDGTLSWAAAAAILATNADAGGPVNVNLLTGSLSVVGGTGIDTAASDSNGASTITVSLETVTSSVSGTFQKVAVDSYGRVTGTSAVAESDITGLIGATFVKVDGTSTMTGNLVMDGNTVTGLGTPTNASDAVPKSYVDGLSQGLDVKSSVRAATTGNITLNGTQSVDGVSLVEGDRVLVKNQSNAAENGIYVVVEDGAWTRASDMNLASEFPGAFAFVEEGTVNADRGFVCTSNAGLIVDTDPVSFTQFSAAGSYTAGVGITLSGTEFQLASSTAGDGLAFNAGVLSVNVTGALEIVADSLQVKAGGIGSTELADGAVATAKIADGAVTTVKIADGAVVAAKLAAEAVDLESNTVTGVLPVENGGTGSSTPAGALTALGAVAKAGDTMSGSLNMDGNTVTGLATPTQSTDAATKDYVDTISIDGGTYI